MRLVFTAGLAAVWLTLAPIPGVALAQDSLSAPTVAAHLTPEQAGKFSKQIETDLSSKGARLAVVFRTGRPHDKLPPGISYTHGAFWVYRSIKTADGRVLNGYAVYNLYTGDGKTSPLDRSNLVQDWPFNFALGSAVDDVAVIIPSPEMQRRIVAVIDSPTYASLHNPSYSLVANPWSSRRQNCNTFMLDVIASSAWNTTSTSQIRADERAHFQPTVVKAGFAMRLFGPVVDKRIKADDQTGPVRTATFESMSDFMRTNGLLESAYILNRAP
jgi:hypothetical protein